MAKVEVKQGWLEGEILTKSTGDGTFYSFKGVPYATPPVGKLRFKAPLPPQPWQGVRKATEHGPSCHQLDLLTQERLPGSEDCLYLNVYTPELKPAKPKAVMVFVHGGGYKSGSGDDIHHGPDFLMSHDIVLVTINYRLEAFGFLCLDTEDVPGNAGLKDQVLAFKWVKENIAKFGGDPENVTIFGESAGGASVALQALSPMTKGLFKRCVPMSGVPICDWSQSFEPRKRAFALGKQLGLETEDPNELLEFLQSLPAVKLIGVTPCVLAYEEITNVFKLLHFTPVAEKDFGQDRFLIDSPENILKSGNINDVDFLIGDTSLELLIGIPFLEQRFMKDFEKYHELLVPRKIIMQTPPMKILEIADRIKDHYFGKKPVSLESMKEFVTYSSHITFTYDIFRFINLLPKKGNGKRYFYRFSSVSLRNIYGQMYGPKYGLTGASHLDDLMYLFDAKHANLKLEKGSKEYDLVQVACTLFTNFAKYGNPTPDASFGVTWPEYGEEQFYGDISDTLTVGKALDADVIAFWKSIYEQAGLEFM